MDHSLQDSRLMHQVVVCGNAGSSRTRKLMHHLQFRVARMGGPQLMHHDLQEGHLMHRVVVWGNARSSRLCLVG